MLSTPFGISVFSTAIDNCRTSPFTFTSKKPNSFPSVVFPSSDEISLISLSKSSGICKASEAANLFPATVSPEVIIRKARLIDYWEVAETHCSCFFPEYSFPLDFVLRIDRLLVAMLASMLSGIARPRGCKRICLVAIIGNSLYETFSIQNGDFKMIGGGFDWKFSLNKGYVAGIVTVDNFADYLPRRRPRRQRRTGIAYISNVAVRENFRRKGIAKKLIAKAESQARSWGCHAIALHCDLNNSMATRLYQGQGFKCIKVPEGAKWPQPKTSPNTRFSFMMKLLNNTPASSD